VRKRAILVLLASLGAAAQAAPDSAVDLRVLEDLSTGSFAEPAGVPVQQTTLRVRYRSERWQAQAEVPWLRVVGAGQAALAPAARPDQGRGDLRVKLTAPLRPASRESTGVDLVLRVNAGRGAAVAGTAPAEAGQALRLALERPLGAWTAFGHVGFKRAGDLPGGSSGRHAIDGEIGAYRMIAPQLEAGAFVDLRQRTRFAAALPEASLYAALQGRDWQWRLFLSRQFGRERSDVAAGFALRGEF